MDGDMSPEEIVRTAKSVGLDAIAVTDHGTVRGGIETIKVAGEDLLVILGSEIKTDSGEIIGLDLKKDVPEGMSPEETCKEIKSQGGFIIAPHPFDRMRRGMGKGLDRIVKYLDAVEVFNARTLVHRFNREALEFSKRYGLPGVSGSDSHFGIELGSAYTLVHSEMDVRSILQSVKKGDVKIVGSSTGVRPHWKTFVTKIARKA